MRRNRPGLGTPRLRSLADRALAPARSRWPGPRPATAGGYPQGTDPHFLQTATVTAKSIANAVTSGGAGTTKGTLVSAAYQLPTNSQVITFVGYQGTFTPAKVATKVANAEEKFIVKGGYVDGKALDVKGVEALSNLPGKDELRATFLATLLAVPQNFLRLTTAAQQNFALLLAARERALGETKQG